MPSAIVPLSSLRSQYLSAFTRSHMMQPCAHLHLAQPLWPSRCAVKIAIQAASESGPAGVGGTSAFVSDSADAMAPGMSQAGGLGTVCVSVTSSQECLSDRAASLKRPRGGEEGLEEEPVEEDGRTGGAAKTK